MEFPDVGEHCSEKTCKQLDFLPMKCDACQSVFCRDHILYMKHSCPSSHLKDIQVPVCPLCNNPVPVKRGQQPDIGVSDHIDNECQSDKAVKKRKVYANRCSLKGCKQKELVQVLCDSCHKNYCLRHRHTQDHECKGFQGTGRSASRAGAAAVNRSAGSSSSRQNRSSSKPQSTALSSIGRDLERERQNRMAARHSGQQSRSNTSPLQAGMSEDEAMARAIQLSLAAEQQASTNQTSSQSPADREAARLQEEEDEALARALAESEQMTGNQPQNRNQQSSSQSSKCHVS